MIARREFITLLGGAATAWPLAARAQHSERMRRIGVLISSTGADPQGQRQIAAFQQGLQELGWMEGQNLKIDFRFLGDEPNRLKAYAAELVALRPDAVLASGPTAVVALQEEAMTIPIVFTQVNDPVGAGVVETLARPGGNATGFTPTEFSIGGKMLEVLRDLVPAVKQVGVILDSKLSDQTGMWRAIEAVTSRFGLGLQQRPRLSIAYPRSTPTATSSKMAPWRPMGRTSWKCTSAQLPTWIVSSKERGPLTCQSSSRRNTN
jgi:putative tryptophan/tyrosine transport system substrate-binding protein